MKVERVILEGLRKGGPIDDGQRVPNPVFEQQASEALFRARRRPAVNDAVPSSDDNHLSTPHSPSRRQSTILEEITRQASVLWNDEMTEGEEDPVTTDEGEGEGEGEGEEDVVQSPTEMT